MFDKASVVRFLRLSSMFRRLWLIPHCCTDSAKYRGPKFYIISILWIDFKRSIFLMKKKYFAGQKFWDKNFRRLQKKPIQLIIFFPYLTWFGKLCLQDCQMMTEDCWTSLRPLEPCLSVKTKKIKLNIKELKHTFKIASINFKNFGKYLKYDLI